MMRVVVADLMQKVGRSVKVFTAESGRQALRSKAAATSLMQCLRKQVHSAGLKRKHQAGSSVYAVRINALATQGPVRMLPAVATPAPRWPR